MDELEQLGILRRLELIRARRHAWSLTLGDPGHIDVTDPATSTPIADIATASLHKLTAGDGYTYLTRQVAVTDSTERGRSTLVDYYSEKGERPGRWVGHGLTGLTSVQPGETVTESQMRALFGEGRHPDADRLQKDVIAAGGSAKQALQASQLGRAYPVMQGEPTPFLVQSQRRYQQYNAERGERLNHPVPDEVRSRIRSEVGLETFETEHGRRPADEQELTSHVTRQSRRPASTPPSPRYRPSARCGRSRRGRDTLVVTKLDRLARSVPDTRDIVDELANRGVRLNVGGSVHDPTDPIGRLLFNVLAMVAEFSVISTRREAACAR